MTKVFIIFLVGAAIIFLISMIVALVYYIIKSCNKKEYFPTVAERGEGGKGKFLTILDSLLNSDKTVKVEEFQSLTTFDIFHMLKDCTQIYDIRHHIDDHFIVFTYKGNDFFISEKKDKGGPLSFANYYYVVYNDTANYNNMRQRLKKREDSLKPLKEKMFGKY